MTHSAALRAPLRALALTTAVLLPAMLLGGCDAIYDDTKGWANRLEAEVLKTAHEMGEPDAADSPEAMTVASAGAAPPAVPVATMEPARLTPPPPAPLPMTPDPGMMAEAASPSVGGAMPMTPDPGMMLAAAPAEAANPESVNATKAMPPHPLPKPEVPDRAQAAPKKPAGKPDQAAADAAHAVVLHLSSLRSEDAAKREWNDLQHSFPRPLAEMTAEIRRTELGDKGTFYRVLAGPLPSRDKAREVCAELKAKNARQYCRILPSKPKAS